MDSVVSRPDALDPASDPLLQQQQQQQPQQPPLPPPDDESAAVDPGKGLSGEAIRVYAESIGLQHFGEEAAKELAEEVTFRLRNLIQEAVKFSLHSRRQRLLPADVDLALRAQGQEPLYGVSTAEHVPFRFASGGGRELHFREDKEVDLAELSSAPLPKIPPGVTLRAHWLAIDGVQPAIPENPPAQSKDQLQGESSNPLSKLQTTDAKDNKLAQVLQSKPTKLKNMETVNVKQLATHELSVEQQLYYKEITEACVGSDEGRRAEALQSLACDPGLHQMLPRLCTFIAEGVRVNVVQHNLAILIYLMRMVKSLLENQTLYLEKYLHELIPAVGTCIVSRQLCTRPDVDNHWALRDFASRLMANICKNFNTSTNNIQTRITRMFSEAMQNERSALVSYYGAIAGLQELGSEVIKVFILPHIKAISQRIDLATTEQAMMMASSMGNIEKIAANHIRTLVVKSVSPVLKISRAATDTPEEYKSEFGSLGSYLHAQVLRSRQQDVNKTPTGSGKTATVLPAAVAVPSPSGGGSQGGVPPPRAAVVVPGGIPQGLVQGQSLAQGQRIFVVGGQQQQQPGQTVQFVSSPGGANSAVPGSNPSTPTATKVIIQQHPQQYQ